MFFLKYRRTKRIRRVRLCGIKKKNIWYPFNLHKLTRKKREAGCNKTGDGAERDAFRKQFLLPVIQVLSYDVAVTAFINRGIIIHKRILG